MPDTLAKAPPVFVERTTCIACGSSDAVSLSQGRFVDDPLRSFINGDPWGENPMPALEHERWDFRQCSNCGQRQHGRIISPEWAEVRFSKWNSEASIRQFGADNADPNVDYSSGQVQHALRLRSLGVNRVLDFGCGFGDFLQMCRLFGMEAHGVDRASVRRAAAGIEIHAELDDVPGEFDAITLFEVLEHLDDPLGMLMALRGRLRAGGLMIVEVPDATGVTGILSRHDYRTIHPLEHINAFTPDSLVAILARAGFRPIDKLPVFVTTSLKRVAKDIAKAKLRQRSTQRYFRADISQILA